MTLIIGHAFKESCPGLRNAKVIGIIHEMQDFQLNVDVYTRWVDTKEAEQVYGITQIESPKDSQYDAIVLAVAHNEFKQIGSEGITKLCKPESPICELKYIPAKRLIHV